MATHSVKNHLRVTIAEYDSAIRTFVPHYAEGLEKTVQILKSLAVASPFISDLGGGTGALSEAVLQTLPHARVELVDLDPEMLVQARLRLSKFGDRISFRHGDFSEPLSLCDGIVASLSLHHVHDIKAKSQVYASINKALKRGGIFLNLDAVVSDNATLSQMNFDHWRGHMLQNGISESEAEGHFEAWKTEDRYFSLHEEFSALKDAGFRQPECFWRRGPMAIYGGLGDG